MRNRILLAIAIAMAGLLFVFWPIGKRVLISSPPGAASFTPPGGALPAPVPSAAPDPALRSQAVILAPNNPAIKTPAHSSSNSPSATAAAALSTKARLQIAAMQEAKTHWQGWQQKLDTHLLYAQQIRTGAPVAPGVSKIRSTLQLDALERVAVDIQADVSPPLLQRIEAAGGTVINSFASYRSIRALIPLTAVETIARLSGVTFIEPAAHLLKHSQTSDSEGDVTHGAAAVRNQYGVAGAGVRVGVLSDSVRYLEDSQSQHALDQVTVLPGQSGISVPGDDDQGEGTAMLEIVHDLAPAAELYFATASGGQGNFATNILRLRASGCDIIVDDVGYGSEAPFQDDIVAQAVNAVIADGALYFSAAGNSGNLRSGTSGTWEGDFVNGGAISDVPLGGRVHDFGQGRLFNTVTRSQDEFLALFWADPMHGATNDYDLYVFDSQDNLVDFSLRSQTGTETPYESVVRPHAQDRVVVVLSSGAPRYLRLSVGGELAISTSGAVAGHACAADAFCVAAVRARSSYPNKFDGGVKNQVETFSSDGPRRIFFSPTDDPVTPGIFSSAGGTNRFKPDIAAADGVHTSVPAQFEDRLLFNPFYGTSAAAPHAAAIAALLKSYQPASTPAEIRAALTGTALHGKDPGWNAGAGYGLLDAEALFSAVYNPSQPSILQVAPASGFPGDLITVSGTNLTGISAVRIGNAGAQFTSLSATQFTFTIPSQAETAFITVSAAHGKAQSPARFTVGGRPQITGFSPDHGRPGEMITIQGSNFVSVSAVAINGTAASNFTVTSPALLSATIPAGAETGPLSITTSRGTARSIDPFRIIKLARISGLSQPAGAIGQTIGIFGTNLDSVISVTFGGILTTNVARGNPDIIWVKVPPQAASGAIRVTTEGGVVLATNLFTVLPVPTNDSFASRRLLANDSGLVQDDSTAATKEPNEPAHAGNQGGKSLWYTWTAPSDGYWTFNTARRAFDTLLAIYKGTVLSNLTLVCSNDNADGEKNSRVFFFAAAGTAYSIAVDGGWYGRYPSDFAGSGPFSLHWQPATPESTIDSVAPLSAAAGAAITLQGQGIDRALLVQIGGVSARFRIDSTNQITAFVPAAANSGPIVVTMPWGGISSRAELKINPGIANDNFSDALNITGPSGIVYGTTAGAGAQPGEPTANSRASGHSVWYAWTAPSQGTWTFDTTGSRMDTALAVFRGQTLGQLSLITSNDDSEDNITSEVSFHAEAGLRYYILVDDAADDPGGFQLHWNKSPLLPVIDSFQPPTGAAGDQLTLRGNNLKAAINVQFEPRIPAAYSINSDSSLTIVVPTGARSGPIRVLTEDGVAVSLSLFQVVDSPPPSNDAPEHASIMQGNAWITTGSNLGLTNQSSNGAAGSFPVWYQWTAPATGAWIADASGSSFKTVLNIFSGKNPVPVFGLPPNEPINGQVKFQATAGMTYAFEVASDNGLTGSIILKLAPITLPALLYQTQFEPEEGFATNFSLQGQQGWTGSARGGSDIVFDWIPGNGQQAVIGFDPAFSAGGSLKLWKPVNYDPAVMGKVVRFSVFLGLSESSGPNSDVFGWTFYNRSAAPLFSILFDNSTLQVGYSLDDGKGFHPTGHSFLNYNNVHLQVLADFQNNRWSAWLGQTPIVDQQPITVANATLDVGRVAALWQAAPGLAPGDNFMIFDDFTLAIETNSLPVIFVQPESQAIPSGGDARLAVAASGLEPLAYQWMFNGVNIPGATNSVLFLPSVQRNQQGAYTVEVRSPFQSALSNPASLQFQDAAAGRISAAQFEADGRFGLEIQGSKDSIYFVESSTDLLQWTPLGAVVITNSTPFIDSKNTVLNYRFYRVRPVR